MPCHQHKLLLQHLNARTGLQLLAYQVQHCVSHLKYRKKPAQTHYDFFKHTICNIYISLWPISVYNLKFEVIYFKYKHTHAHTCLQAKDVNLFGQVYRSMRSLSFNKNFSLSSSAIFTSLSNKFFLSSSPRLSISISLA